MNLEIAFTGGVSHFGADELYLECSIKFAKNMGSSPIELINKTPPFRRCVHDLEIPHLQPLFGPNQPLGTPPPQACTPTQSQAPPTGPGYASRLPSPSPTLVDDSRAAASVGGTALGLQSSTKFGLAQHVRHTLSSYVPSAL